MPQAKNAYITPKKTARTEKARKFAVSDRRREKALPTCLRGKAPVDTVFIPPDLDPLAYGMGCTGNCLEPLIFAGDTVICSPSTKPQPGMIIAFSWKDGRQGTLKRLVSELYGVNKGGNCQPLIAVEMDNPPQRFYLDPGAIDKAHAVIGVVRNGNYIALKPKVRK